MSPRLAVDLSSPTPPYEQIRSQITSLIALGELSAESRLPTVRALASDLGVAAGTVARAYKELESQGLIESRRRSGTVVAAQVPAAQLSMLSSAHRDSVLAAIEQLILSSQAAGLGQEITVDLLRSRLQKG
ncbi:transcriptional regulator, GntR family [Renibacterium salmoninarum ATCC 33209]|uniref:Transcriptional regulator, GntR family n=1 Tax=Renibacterium salmoninarum (strain ATCC 33209 / DSM 20767 / JCM 11484 / NBRC 15589 / NCIMB 2235) TaxID=288705 RepID=A9WNH4_RENSM|nr:GntR family transcriptional regulator [Renibacterium salmoninarum]ABY22701.1 transcriptional regulator, GntR family [Renibacterium salmoninarum ATCC 33209]